MIVSLLVVAVVGGGINTSYIVLAKGALLVELRLSAAVDDVDCI